MGRGNQYIQLIKFVYCKPENKKQPTFPNKVQALNSRPQRWEASVLPLLHSGTPVTEHDHHLVYRDFYKSKANSFDQKVCLPFHSVVLSHWPELCHDPV